jgi:hypothetical protein
VETRLFEWAEQQGLSQGALARMTGYSERQLRRVRDGRPVSEHFQATIVLRLGDWARSLFLPSVSQERDGCARARDVASKAYKATDLAQDERGDAIGQSDTCAAKAVVA